MADDTDRDTDEEADAAYFVVSHGRVVDFLKKLPDPVLALPGRTLYRVLLHGNGFRLPVDGQGPPIAGFYTTRIVSARARLEAEAKAQAELRDYWETVFPNAVGELQLHVEETEALEVRFRLRSATGMTFYTDDDDS